MKTTPEQLKRLVNEQHAVISRLRQALDAEVECSSTLREENARLRAALKPFADVAAQFDFADDNEGISGVLLGDLRAAAAAIRDEDVRGE